MSVDLFFPASANIGTSQLWIIYDQLTACDIPTACVPKKKGTVLFKQYLFLSLALLFVIRCRKSQSSSKRCKYARTTGCIQLISSGKMLFLQIHILLAPVIWGLLNSVKCHIRWCESAMLMEIRGWRGLVYRCS